MANMAELYFRLHLLERSNIYCVKIVMLNEKKCPILNGPVAWFTKYLTIYRKIILRLL